MVKLWAPVSFEDCCLKRIFKRILTKYAAVVLFEDYCLKRFLKESELNMNIYWFILVFL